MITMEITNSPHSADLNLENITHSITECGTWLTLDLHGDKNPDEEYYFNIKLTGIKEELMTLDMLYDSISPYFEFYNKWHNEISYHPERLKSMLSDVVRAINKKFSSTFIEESEFDDYKFYNMSRYDKNTFNFRYRNIKNREDNFLIVSLKSDIMGEASIKSSAYANINIDVNAFLKSKLLDNVSHIQWLFNTMEK